MKVAAPLSPGSARASRAGAGAPPARTFLVCDTGSSRPAKPVSARRRRNAAREGEAGLSNQHARRVRSPGPAPRAENHHSVTLVLCCSKVHDTL